MKLSWAHLVTWASRASLASALALGAGSTACEAESPPRGPEETCAKSCEVRASHCSKHECARGCNLVLDRLAEHEESRVLACVARAADRCDDRTWATCATRVGPHADGGPPAPPPAEDDEDEE